MDNMTAAHAKPERRDLIWVLALIAASGLIEVWGSWLQVGAVSGFPKLGGMTTGWVLPVTAEAYWATALAAWLVYPAGLRSRRFAMWTAGLMFVLSLCGQEADHLVAFAHRTVPPVGVVMLVTALPLLAIALIAVLIHLRHLDRTAAEEAERQARAATADAQREAAEASELGALRAELDAAREALAGTAAERETALREAAEAAAKTEILTRKLAAAAGRKRTPKPPAKKPATPPRSKGAEDPATEVPNDVDAQAEALSILAAEPEISGAKLGSRVGRSERWGQTFKQNLTLAATPDGQGPEE